MTNSNQCAQGSIDADHVRRLTQIGLALSAEKDIRRLLGKILTEARAITHADGGTLYMMSENLQELHFAFVQNDSLNLNMGGTGGEMTWPSVKLTAEDGRPDHSHVSAHVVLTGMTVNIPDVYDANEFNYTGTRSFDSETGYRSRSMLVVPMRNHENDIIGVLQLLNAKDPATGRVVAFSEKSQALAMSLASQAAVALTKNRLIADLENLLDAFIKSIATTIDEKSPYTGGHVRRVADLTMKIAEKINETAHGPYAGVRFSPDQMKELNMAAWLHDVGKIATPEHVVDKATRLEKVYDRIGDVKTRFELLKRECHLSASGLKNKSGMSHDRLAEELKALDDDCQFLEYVNCGQEFTSDEMIERIRKIAGRQWAMNAQTLPLLSEDELYNLCVRRGTLNEEERAIINNHVMMTYKMLSKLPFPRKLGRIAEFAAAHHERLDGSGYPLGLQGDALPLQARIIALADIFEALTAKDRPYKKGKTLSEALILMKQMVKDRHIDSDLFDLFIKEKIYLDYAENELEPHQKDIQ